MLLGQITDAHTADDAVRGMLQAGDAYGLRYWSTAGRGGGPAWSAVEGGDETVMVQLRLTGEVKLPTL